MNYVKMVETVLLHDLDCANENFKNLPDTVHSEQVQATSRAWVVWHNLERKDRELCARQLCETQPIGKYATILAGKYTAPRKGR